MPPTTTTSAREARSVPFRTLSPASATCRAARRVPITKAVRPERVSASRCWSAPPTVTTSPQRRADADLPEPRHVVLGRAARVVGREGDALARVAQRLERLDRARGGLVADPHAAVEIEDELVVARRRGGDSGTSLAYAAMLRPLSVLLCALALAARRLRRRRRLAAGADEASQTAHGSRGGADRPAARTSSSRAPRDGRRAEEADSSRSTPARPTRSTLDHELRRLHDPARPEDLAERGGVVRRARAQRLLRRHDLPPHRPRLRDPGRRPDRQRHRRPRLLDAAMTSRRRGL